MGGLFGGGGGSQPQPTDQTITQTQFPAEAKPYYQRLLSRGEAESLQPYAAYPSQRLAEFAPEEQQAFGMTRHLANQGTPWAMQQAQQTAGQQARGRPFEPWTGFQPQMPQPRIPQMPWQGGLGPDDRPLRQPMYRGQQSQMAPGGFSPFQSREFDQQQQQLIDQQYSKKLGEQQQPTEQQMQTQIDEPSYSPTTREFQQRTADISSPYGTQRQQLGQQQLGQQQQFGAQQMRQPMTPAPQAYGRGAQPWQQDRTFMGANYGIPGLSTGYQSPMQRYMSPYQQGVTDIAKERAIRDADRMRSEIGMNAASRGGLGGYREGIVESNLNRDLMRNLSNIQTQGLQSGYESAQQQFERDRAARLGQEGAQLSAAQLLGGFAPQAQQMALERIGALGGVGGQRRGFRQAGMDIGYEDFLRQQGYPQQQIGFQSNIIRGLGLQPSQTVSTYAQRPGLFQSALGSGLGALGLYRGMGGM